ncbi:MAG: phosphotriesterase [Candidatus Dormibacteria bacterium]
MTAYVQTILGPKPPGTLARVATHEHLLKFDDTAMVLDELAAFRAEGGSTIVEVSTLGIVDIADRAQHAERLATISRESGVQIIAGTGFYKEPRLPSFVMDWSMERLANHMITEIREGIGGTDHQAGIIGEVGSSNYQVFPTEEKVLRAAGLAQAATGVAISTHTGRATMVHNQLDLFEDEGARLDRVVIGHLDVHPHLNSLRNVYQEVLDRGAYVQFDTVGKEGFFELELDPEYGQKFPYDPERAEMIAELVRDGYVERILISCDIDTLSLTCAHGGGGYARSATFDRDLKAAGLTNAQIRTITVDNPARVLATLVPA